jgi:diacylglycerol kinase (ATP)
MEPGAKIPAPIGQRAERPATVMTENKRLTFDGRLRSVKFALRGIRTMVTSQHNAWIHAAATVCVVAAGLILGLSASEWIWIVLAVGSVWTAEALNTAFEFLTDVASPDFHPLAEKAKDVAAGAVLIAAVGAVIIGGLVFWRKVIGLLQ